MRTQWASDRVRGDEYDVPRRPGDDDTLGVSMLKVFGLLVLLVPWYGLRHPGTTVLLVATAWVWTAYGMTVLLAAYAVLAVVLVVWSRWRPGSFSRFVADPFRSRVRGAWVYRRRWRSAMHMCGLAKTFGTRHYLPHIVRVRSNRHVDRVRVKLLPGQCTETLAVQAQELAATFHADACTVRTAKPGVVWLCFTRRDPLTAPIPALEPSEPVDLEALPVGVHEDGQPWTLGLLGTHVLVAGATNAGKGSVIWSAIRALAPAVRDGLVQLWTLDPKGGMELAPGTAMFTRFAHEPERMVTTVEQAATLVRTRAARLRGITRQLEPSPAAPFVVLVIDELAFLTAYTPDRDATKRFTAALSVVLSQGRAVGVTVLAAVQDPRKEIITMRDLFPTRVALRLSEADQVRLVLGDGAHDRGAACDTIPASLPGVGYVLLDGHPEPARVRAAYVTDDDIAAMTRTYPTPTYEPAGLGASVAQGEVAA